jgi:GntR family transcriptional regulator, negative regulator for fad regulon and positive regulator of fabA
MSGSPNTQYPVPKTIHHSQFMKSLKRSGTPEAQRRVLKRSGTPEAQRRVLERSGTPEAQRRVLERSGTPEAQRRVLERSGTPEAQRRVLERSGTPEAQRRVLERSGTPEAQRRVLKRSGVGPFTLNSLSLVIYHFPYYHTGMTTDQTKHLSDRSYQPILKPAEIAEYRLIEAILNDTFPINSHLPAERELSELIGVTRPTLRETLQRLARDGWVEIHQGKPTRVRDYWKEGCLGVLNALSEHLEQLPKHFITDLLNVRLAMAPTYTFQAVATAPDEVLQILDDRHQLDQSPEQFTHFDWHLQHHLTVLSKNPVFVMILNSFKDLFLNLAPFYFSIPEAREHSSIYYEAMAKATSEYDPEQAKMLTEAIMRESLYYWQQTQFI